MRKFVLVSALLLASVSAQAGENRSLSLTGLPTVTSTAAEAPKPIAQVAVRLAQAATTANDAAPVQVQAPAAAPVQVLAQAPAATQTTAPAPAAATTTTTATTTATDTKSATATESKPKAVKKVRRETDEQKARRIAAKYGVYW